MEFGCTNKLASSYFEKLHQCVAVRPLNCRLSLALRSDQSEPRGRSSDRPQLFLVLNLVRPECACSPRSSGTVRPFLLLQTFLRPGLTKVMLYRDRLLTEAEEDRRWQLYIHFHCLSPPLSLSLSPPYFGLKEKKKKKRKTLFRILSNVGPLLNTHLRTFPVSMRERKQFGVSFVPPWIKWGLSEPSS